MNEQFGFKVQLYEKCIFVNFFINFKADGHYLKIKKCHPFYDITFEITAITNRR